MAHLYCNNDNCEAEAVYKVVDGGQPVLFLCESCGSAYEDGQERPSVYVGDIDELEESKRHYCNCCDADALMYREAGDGDVEYLCCTHATAFEWGQIRPTAEILEITDADTASWDDDPLSGEYCQYCGKVILPRHGTIYENQPHHHHCIRIKETVYAA